MKLKPVVSVALIWILGGSLSGLIAARQTCLAQDIEMAGTAVSGSTPVPQAGSIGSRLANLISLRERSAPAREEGVALELLGKHIKFVSGGFVQGEGFIFGLEFTTADRIKWIEFRASALTSTKLYRRFEGIAYLPEVGDKRTHAEIWYSYLRRTKDKFFGIGPRTPDDFRTNFDLEQRALNATFYRE
jgi:hypothetical protein